MHWLFLTSSFCSIGLHVCFYHAFIIALYYNLKSESVNPSTLFFLKILLGILGLFFGGGPHTNFKIFVLFL